MELPMKTLILTPFVKGGRPQGGGIFLALCLMNLGTAYAGPEWDNWLVGLSVGYADRVGSLVITSEYDVDITGAYQRLDLHYTGFIWNAFVGYQSICGPWLKGLS